jgi:hypothetical protein
MIETNEILKVDVYGSSCISAFEYWKDKKILRVVFTHGGTFDYSDIPEELVRKWMQEGEEGSYGKFFNKEIRNLKGVIA